MASATYNKVIDALVENGIHEEFAHLYVRKGLKDLGISEDDVEEKTMGIVLQKHVLAAIQMFVDKPKAQKIIHKITLAL